MLWGTAKDIKESSDEYAVNISTYVHSVFSNFQDTILILDDQEKSVSSSVGHALMDNNPFSSVRFKQAKRNLFELYNALIEGDLQKFIEIIEYEALSLHAMMLTSYPGYFLIQPNTIALINKIREYRSQTGIPVGFTLDAGPNIHLLFPGKYHREINNFIQEELIQLCKQGRFIKDCVGTGPVRMNHG